MANGIIGVLGGMGPEATLALFERIIRATPATKDQDHLRVIIDSNPKIPDRTTAIKGHGKDCLPFLIETGRNLEQAGASFIVMPCNTAHYWLEKLQKALSIPILDMIAETADTAAGHEPRLHRLGLMATDGTLATGLYQHALTARGIQLVAPSPDGQKTIMETIYRVKAGDYSLKPAILAVARGLLTRGAEGIVLGCTEIPLVVGPEDLPCPVFDPLRSIAAKAVSLARDGLPPPAVCTDRYADAPLS